MKWIYFVIPALIIILGSCNSANEKSAKDDKIRVVCTTGIIGDALENITTEKASVVSLMGPGTDPHLYKPDKDDVDQLYQADIIVANGLHLEGKMQEILEKLQHKKLVVFVGDGIDKDQLLFPEKGYTVPDPHIWFDVHLWRDGLQHVERTIAESEFSAAVDSAGAQAYFSQLKELDQEVDLELKKIPNNRRILVTAHDAFSYFGRRYEMRIESLQGISTLSGYGLRDIQELTKLIIDRQITAVFVESSIPKRSIQAVIDGCRAKGFNVEAGGTLYSDALGPANSPEGTYIGMVRTNTKTIVNALK